jgi:peptidoglycan/LPS O-acetylase OafA/YrhL
VVFHSPWVNIYEDTDTRFDAILFGCVLAILFNPRFGDPIASLRKHARVFALAGLALLVFTFAWRAPFFRDIFRYSLQSLALMPIFFYVTLPRPGVIAGALAARPLRWIGQLSYSMYLIHHTLFHHIYHSHRPGFAAAAAVLVLSVVYAQGMRTFVELPLQRLRSRLGHSRTPRRASVGLPLSSQAPPAISVAAD